VCEGGLLGVEFSVFISVQVVSIEVLGFSRLSCLTLGMNRWLCFFVVGLIVMPQWVLAGSSNNNCVTTLRFETNDSLERTTFVWKHLRLVSKEFCRAQVKDSRDWQSLEVIAAHRSPITEARYILSCLRSENKKYKQCKHYENQKAILVLRNILEDNPKANDKTMIKLLGNKIASQVRSGCVVSKHLIGHAVNLNMSDGSPEEVARLKNIILNYRYKVGNKRNKIMLKEKGKGSSRYFHLNFPPYGYNLWVCPGG